MLLELRVKVDHEYERWIVVSKQTLADGKVNCEEAEKWLAWYRERKKAIQLLKKEINLEIKQIRTQYRIKLAAVTVHGGKTALREEQAVELAPFEELHGKVERLLLEGEKLKPTLERFLEKDCE